MTDTHNEHDASYKNLFSHPQMVQDLIQGFVHEPWVQDIDFSTLETAGSEYITDDLAKRSNDIIWRVKFKDQWLYLYIMLEFQSTVDALMAVRVLTYVGLLYQALIKNGKIENHQLPPILPIVLYNGERRWNAPCSIQDGIVQPGNGLQR